MFAFGGPKRTVVLVVIDVLIDVVSSMELLGSLRAGDAQPERSPRMRRASCTSFGMIVTRLA